MYESMRVCTYHLTMTVHIQGSYSKLDINFKDFSRTFQYQNIFQDHSSIMK